MPYNHKFKEIKPSEKYIIREYAGKLEPFSHHAFQLYVIPLVGVARVSGIRRDAIARPTINATHLFHGLFIQTETNTETEFLCEFIENLSNTQAHLYLGILAEIFVRIVKFHQLNALGVLLELKQ